MQLARAQGPDAGSHNPRFGLQFDTEPLTHRVAHALCEPPQLRAAGMTVIDEHQSVAIGHAGVTVARTLETGPFDEPRGGELGFAGA